MSEHELRQALQNRWRYRVTPLFESASVRGVLRQAARELKRREAAQEALERSAPADWAGKVEVARVDADLAVLTTADAVVAERARRMTERILRILQSGAAQIRRVEIALISPEAASDEEVAPDAPRGANEDS